MAQLHLQSSEPLNGSLECQELSMKDIKTQILKLSRENSDVRSLAMSLNQKRKVTVMCQATLAALEQAIQEEPIAGKRYEAQSPR